MPLLLAIFSGLPPAGGGDPTIRSSRASLRSPAWSGIPYYTELDTIVAPDARTADFKWRAVRWSPSGAIQDLKVSCEGWCAAQAINDAGMIVGYRPAPKGQRAFVWLPISGAHDLPQISDGDVSMASDINASGEIVGYDRGTGTHRVYAVLWHRQPAFLPNWKLQVLPDLGGPVANATGINNDGLVVGVSQLSDASGHLLTHAILWRAGQLLDLNVAQGQPSAQSSANDIDESGRILIVGPSRYLWTPTDGFVGLPTADMPNALGMNNKLRIFGVGNTSVFPIVGTLVFQQNQPPVAESRCVATNLNTPVAIHLTASDPDNDAVSYEIATPPKHGTLSGALPAVTYMPTTGFQGTDAFIYRARDSHGMPSTDAAVVITIGTVSAADAQSCTGNGNHARPPRRD